MPSINLNKLAILMRFAMHRLREVRLPQVAGSLTFTTLLALVPILAVAFSIFTAFPLFATFRSSIEAYLVQNLMPKGVSNTIMSYLTQFATKATRVSAISGVALFLTTITTLAMIDRTFNQIWNVRRGRPWMQRLLIYWALLSLGPLMIGGSISLTMTFFSATNDVVKTIPWLASVFYAGVSIVLATATYSLLYLLVPNRAVYWRDALIGGFIAACAFELVKRLFASFISQFPTYTVVYGALAAIPIFLIWIYLCWVITLLGAIITAALPILKHERWWHVPRVGGEFEEAVKILIVLVEARLGAEGAAVSLLELKKKTKLGLVELENLLGKMAELGWVVRANLDADSNSTTFWRRRLAREREPWLLQANPDHLYLWQVFLAFVYDTSVPSELNTRVSTTIVEGFRESLTEYTNTIQN